MDVCVTRECKSTDSIRIAFAFSSGPETSNKAPMPYRSQSQASVDGMVNEAKIDAHLAGQAPERTCLDHPETPSPNDQGYQGLRYDDAGTVCYKASHSSHAVRVGCLRPKREAHSLHSLSARAHACLATFLQHRSQVTIDCSHVW